MDSSRIDLSKYRLEKAIETIDTSKVMLSFGKYSDSLNRSYYSVFHAIRSVLALDGYDSKKHSGIIAYFNQNYIKTGKLYKKLFVRNNRTLIFMILNNKKHIGKPVCFLLNYI